jgi:hypothetical protein
MADASGHRTRPERTPANADHGSRDSVTIDDLKRIAETFADVADPELMRQAWDQPDEGELKDLHEPWPQPHGKEPQSDVLNRGDAT